MKTKTFINGQDINSLKELAKSLDFSEECQYFEYCIESYYNGNISQCRELFNRMKREDKHKLISYIRDNYANDQLHNFFISLF